MILLSAIILFALTANIGLGITVYFTNRHRKANQAFLISSTFMFLWLCANLLILHSTTESEAITNINIASALSACLPTSFQLLRLAITFPSDSFHKLVYKNRKQIAFNAIAIAVCFIPGFTDSVDFSESQTSINLAKPDYGAPFIIFLFYMLGSILILALNVYYDRKRLTGSKRLELDFLIFASLSGLIVGIFLGTIFGLITQSANSVPIANAASVLTVSGIVAYGISVHKILTVSFLLRKIFAYTLLIFILSTIYYITLSSATYLCRLMAIPSELPPHLLTTLVVAFAMLPVRQRMFKATEILFGTSGVFDIKATVRKADEIFQSVTTIDALMSQFSALLEETLNAENVTILTADSSKFSESYSSGTSTKSLKYSHTDPLVQILEKTHEPTSIDSLVRMRQTQFNKDIIDQLQKDNVTIATGIFTKSKIRGIVLFGARKKGKIYDKTEQDALQILCNQFSVALENAELYTKMQDSKIQNEIMLDQMVSGIVVANPEREVTLFNHEAQRITGLKESTAVGQSIEVLPREIHLALTVTLENQQGIKNIDATLLPDEDSETSPKHIRMGSAFLYGHDGKPMGALLVFTDITEFKSLEEQVRRTDQLSSVGTLAAGMAHEIKNPLVTIKTFTQLLPKRYADDDFRNDFASLVAHEVDRIDGIVNELLSFSKPAQPHLIPMNVQETIDQALKLIHEQLAQKNIQLQNKCRAEHTEIFGDAKLLSQALINLNLNAIESIAESGTITVGTLNCTHRFANGDSPEKAITRKCIRIQISDTGKGIERENLQKIFDPFYTNKSEGTGMGLSVAHGIITEHHGVIEVESQPGRGTSFYLYIPLLEHGVKS
ncbi:ATP-binding protein [Pontiellaceae bacterium B12219]|nr:ATP-binding protein [Pontiellaceae bacterium B12219]